MAEQPVIVLYCTEWCGYCVRAKRLLEKRGLPFQEVRVDDDDEKREWLVQVTGRTTVPQIFIDDRPIGGYTELAALDASGELGRMTKAS